jgi:hypothetical protein
MPSRRPGSAKVGSISQSRCEQIVAELRDVVEQQTRGQFTIGDRALEIEPMRHRGGLVTETNKPFAAPAHRVGLALGQDSTARAVQEVTMQRALTTTRIEVGGPATTAAAIDAGIRHFSLRPHRPADLEASPWKPYGRHHHDHGTGRRALN